MDTAQNTHTDTDYVPPQCYWCQRVPEDGDGRESSRLRLCARCRRIRYCGTDCQRKDWKHHKPECAAITEGMEKTKTARLAPRAILHTAPQTQTQNPSSTSTTPPPESETVYFLKRAVPHVRDVSISGPHWPLDSLQEKVEKCPVDVGSDPGYNVWLDHVEEHPTILPVRIVAALPKCEGFIELDIIRLLDPEAAAHLRSRGPGPGPGPSPHKMEPVFAVIEQLADTDFLTQQSPEDDKDRYREGHVPLLDARVDSVFLGRTEANQRVVQLLQLRKKENPKAVTDVDELDDGTAIGVVEQPKGTVSIRVLVVESGGDGDS